MKNEIWKPIKDYEYAYEVSNFGRVRSIPRYSTKGRILKPSFDKDGYFKVTLSKNNIKKQFSIHRLVLKTFTPTSDDKLVINHINEIKSDNRVENLEWCTIKYNTNYNQTTFKRGMKRRKPIMQSKNGVPIRTWDSSTTASLELGISRTGIISCLQGRQKFSGKFKWEYASLKGLENGK